MKDKKHFLGKKHKHFGEHMPSVVVGLVRKFRTMKHDKKEIITKTGTTDPRVTDNPYPNEGLIEVG